MTNDQIRYRPLGIDSDLGTALKDEIMLETELLKDVRLSTTYKSVRKRVLTLLPSALLLGAPEGVPTQHCSTPSPSQQCAEITRTT